MYFFSLPLDFGMGVRQCNGKFDNIYYWGSDGSKTTNTGINLVVGANFGQVFLYYKKAAKMDHVVIIKRVKKL